MPIVFPPSTVLDRHGLVAIALLVLAITAGCLGGHSPGPTPAPLVTDTPDPGAPGIERGAVSNVTALLDAHEDALLERGFVARVESDGATFRYTVARNRSAFRIEPVENATFAAWSNGSVTLVRQGDAYRRVPAATIATGELTQSDRLRALLTAAKYEVAGRTRCAGSRCLDLRANGSFGTYRDFDATARVTRAGAVVRFEAEYVKDGRDGHYRFDLRRRGDPSIARPTWVAEALDATEDGS